MKKIYKYSFAISLLIAFTGCSPVKGPHFAEGTIGNQLIAENLDSDIAKSALVSTDSQNLDPRIEQIIDSVGITGTPSPVQLQALTQKGSTDFASIIYARQLLSEHNNRYWHSRSLDLSTRLDTIGLQSRLQNNFSRHHALLIPGWHWKTRTDTGADLKFQRNMLASYGLSSSLVETNEHGSVEENAMIIADAIRAANKINKSILIISVSKGGADTAYALGNVVDVKSTPYLRGWLNIGGIISGSTLVDLEINDPEKWLTSIGFAKDTPLNAIESLQKKVAIKRLSALNIPRTITVVNYVALPFASTLSEQSRYSYQRLAQYGPNDGAALTHEMLMPGRQTVLEFGLDHFMRHLKAMYRAIAILYMMTEHDS